MSEEPKGLIDTGEPEQEYVVTITALLPSQTRATSYTITVYASCPMEAYAKAEMEWKNATELRDVRVKLTEKTA